MEKKYSEETLVGKQFLSAVLSPVFSRRKEAFIFHNSDGLLLLSLRLEL